MPAVFDKLGIRFQYPDNWTLDETEALEGNETVTVYSPGGAFWSIVIHPRGQSPAVLAEAAVKALRQEYEGIESEPVEETIAGQRIEGFDLNFFYLDLTSTAQVRSFGTDEATYLLLCQAEDREFAEIGPVFRAMTRSLLK
jgi:hypothetical protein